MDKDIALVHDMLAAAREAAGFVSGCSQDAFRRDLRTFRACERCLEIIGEAAAKVSKSFRSAHPHVPWAKAKGMRNVLIHEYRAVQFDIVYTTVTDNVPALAAQLEMILQDNPP